MISDDTDAPSTKDRSFANRCLRHRFAIDVGGRLDMSRQAMALEFDEIALAIEQLPGVSRRHPEQFLEAKSEVAGRCARRAAEMRSGASWLVGGRE